MKFFISALFLGLISCAHHKTTADRDVANIAKSSNSASGCIMKGVEGTFRYSGSTELLNGEHNYIFDMDKKILIDSDKYQSISYKTHDIKRIEELRKLNITIHEDESDETILSFSIHSGYRAGSYGPVFQGGIEKNRINRIWFSPLEPNRSGKDAVHAIEITCFDRP